MKNLTPKPNPSIQAAAIGTLPSKHLSEDSRGVARFEVLGDGVPVIDAISVTGLREFFELLDGWDRSYEKDSRDLSSFQKEHGRESVLEHNSGGYVGLADRTTLDHTEPRRRLTSVL